MLFLFRLVDILLNICTLHWSLLLENDLAITLICIVRLFIISLTGMLWDFSYAIFIEEFVINLYMENIYE